jgi:signal transduction histidine kinase
MRLHCQEENDKISIYRICHARRYLSKGIWTLDIKVCYVYFRMPANSINSQSPLKRDFESILGLSNHIMYLALCGLLRYDFLKEVSKVLMQSSGSDSVVMWLKERGKFYWSELLRSQEYPFSFEIMPGVPDKEQGIIPKLRKNTWLERLSRKVFLGQHDSSLSRITPNGSFWTGNAEIYKGKSAGHTNYRSVVLVPIRVEKENIGLLELFSKSKDFFTKKNVEICEGIAQTLKVALGYRRTQVELRERVKELTCLYGIAKIVEQESLTIRDILQKIVMLLPPAWLYPEIASARIILDDQTYATPHFKAGVHKQTAKIIVGGLQKGIVEVTYREEKPELDEGPFLREERSLIDTVAREILLIIERTQIEEDKEQLQEQLRHADRLATIGQLSAGVAHELNEPIGGILGFAQLVQKDPGLSDQTKKDIEKIMRASLHAREVIKKLMLFARQMPPQKTRVNLNQIVKDGLYFLESRCAKEGIKVVCQLSSPLPDVTADQSQMTQVLVNTVVNAIQAMSNSGKLTIQTQASSKFVSLIVKDTGVGMEKNVMSKIFQPFFTTKDVGLGTGLGLSVVYGIVTSHGGSIDMDSKIGQGTRIKIKLPRTEPAKAKGEM